MPSTFQGLLAELIKLATLPDDPIGQEFHDGDVVHLQRWLDSREANPIWHKITNGAPFNSGDAFLYVRHVLGLRRAAQKADRDNREISGLEHKQKRLASKALKRAHGERRRRIEQILQHPKFFDPFLSNRSDNKGSRKRTIFCRVLSDTVHDVCGKWLDAEVEVLCQIAFDYAGDVDARSARRPSTRKKRRKKPSLKSVSMRFLLLREL